MLLPTFTAVYFDYYIFIFYYISTFLYSLYHRSKPAGHFIDTDIDPLAWILLFQEVG